MADSDRPDTSSKKVIQVTVPASSSETQDFGKRKISETSLKAYRASTSSSASPFPESQEILGKRKHESERRKSHKRRRIYFSLGLISVSLIIFAVTLIAIEILDEIKEERRMLEELAVKKQISSSREISLGKENEYKIETPKNTSSSQADGSFVFEEQEDISLPEDIGKLKLD